MARNYGIAFCREGIRILEAEETRLFKAHNHGFDKFSQEGLQLRRYRRMLNTFIAEKEAGLAPSYNPEIHGSLMQ